MFKKLFKFLLKSVLWILAILLIIATIGYFTAGLWIKPVVSFVVPKITQTKASIESADISLFSGRLALKGLKIGNPAGFSDPNVFELNEVSLRFQPKSVFTQKIIVDQVLIKGTRIVAEYNKNAQMNLMVLNDNIQSALNKGQEKSNVQVQPQKKPVQQKSTKTVVIKDLQIVDTSVHFALMGRGVTMNLPNIQEKNIGEQKKMTWSESIQLITDKLTMEPIEELSKSSQKALQNAFKVIEDHTVNTSAVKELKNSLKSLGLF